MAKNELIKFAFEELAQAFRVLLEADWRANSQRLIFVDRPEAVGNIETAFTGVLNGFHSLYDAINKQLANRPIEWYESGPLAFILAIRNARHHNHANRIRTLYTYHAQEAKSPASLEQYVLVDFPAGDEGGDTFDVFLSWNDLRDLFRMDMTQSRLKQKTIQTICHYLCVDKFSDYAGRCGLNEAKVLFNVVPLIVNAAASIVPLIRDYCGTDSVESKFFRDHFSSVSLADTSTPSIDCGPFLLPS